MSIARISNEKFISTLNPIYTVQFTEMKMYPGTNDERKPVIYYGKDTKPSGGVDSCGACTKNNGT